MNSSAASTRSRQWCWHGGAFVERRLGGADVHPSVDLHGIDGDQFDVGVPAGEGHRHVALARRGRPEDDQRRSGSHPARTAIRRLCNGSASNSTNCADEVVRGTVGDLDGCVGTGAQRLRRREVHQLVLASATRQHGGILLAGTLDEHLFDPADAGLVLGQRAALDDDAQPLEPLGRNGRLDEPVVHLGGLGARPRREDERVGVVVLRGGRDLEGGREVVVGLARESRR